MFGSEQRPLFFRWHSSRMVAAAVLLISACLVLVLPGCDLNEWNPLRPKAALQFHNIDITGAPYAQALTLPDASGQVRTLGAFKGKVVFVFFGFTQCPDVCPTTMAELAQVRKQLGAQADRLQGIFVTLDPERDTSQMLQDYVRAMDPSFIALRGTPKQTADLAQAFKIFYQKVPSPSGEGYTIDHTAGAYVFDPQGKVRLFVRYGSGTDKLLADIKTLLVP
jgi:protein SCO1